MLSLFRNQKVLFAVIIILSVVNSGLSVAVAFILERITNSVVYADWELFRVVIVEVVIFVVAVGVVALLTALAEKKLIVNVVREIRSGLHRGIFSRDTENYRKTNTADYISALTNDVKIIEENILLPFIQSIQMALIFVMATVALFYYNLLIGGLMIASLIVLYLLPASLGKPIGTRQSIYSQNLSLFTIKLKDQFAGYEVIRSFRLADRSKRDFNQQNKQLADSKYSVDRFIATSEGLSGMLSTGTQLGIMLLAAYFVFQGQLAAGALIAILQLAGIFVTPVQIIMQYIPIIQGAKPVLERIQQLSVDQPSAFKGSEQPTFEQGVLFDAVQFGYLPDQLVLKNLDGELQKGKKYALVGGSGCGKTTLIKLLSAGYSTYSGSISFDGKELHELDIDKLLTLMSVIHQDVYMFDETIKDNIDLHREYDQAEWGRALSISGVDRFLDQTEQGLDTAVGENGINLSGGQRQRVAVARALIERKPLLILDEGTSAVDSRTAYDIETALLGIDDLTIVTITHNLSPDLLKRYDAILYMEDGRIKESGSYDSLMKAQGSFAGYQRLEDAENETVAGA